MKKVLTTLALLVSLCCLTTLKAQTTENSFVAGKGTFLLNG